MTNTSEISKHTAHHKLLTANFILFLLALVFIVCFKGVNVLLDEEKILYNLRWAREHTVTERFLYQFSYNNFYLRKIITNIIPNMLIFLPFGIFLPLLFRQKFHSFLLWMIGCSLGIEIFELLTGLGGFEFTDIAANVAGAALGFLLYTLLKNRISTHVCHVLNIAVCVVAVPAVVYMYIQVILHFHIFLQ